QSIEQGVDTVIVNRFGPLEAAGRGFRDAILAASETQTPLIIAVPEFEFERWTRFSRGMTVRLECTLDSVLCWRRRVSSAKPSGRLPHAQARELFKGCSRRHARSVIRARSYFAIITWDALMIAQTSSPFVRPSSATASLVIADVTITPWPISTLTCEVVAPVITSMILPLSWLRALSFMGFSLVDRTRLVGVITRYL